MRLSLFGIGLTGLATCLAIQTHSACGLNFCPRLETQEKKTVELGIMTKQVGFDLGGTSGSYTEFMPEVAFLLGNRWVFGANLPVIILNIDNQVETGISNPMGFAEYRFQPMPNQRMSAGLQIEVPLGNYEKGMAGNHFMAVPYLSWLKPMHSFSVGGSLGGSFGISGEHGHGAADTTTTPLYVNPHENMEILYRLTSGTSLWNKRVNPEISLNGQHVLTEENTQGKSDNYLTVGLAAPLLVGSLTVLPIFEMPITESRRFDWALGVTLRIKI